MNVRGLIHRVSLFLLQRKMTVFPQHQLQPQQPRLPKHLATKEAVCSVSSAYNTSPLIQLFSDANLVIVKLSHDFILAQNDQHQWYSPSI
jgi:hypothetical protein